MAEPSAVLTVSVSGLPLGLPLNGIGVLIVVGGVLLAASGVAQTASYATSHPRRAHHSLRT